MKEVVYKYLLRFVDVSHEELSYIMQQAEIRHFSKKVKLIDIGESEGYLNFIITGLVRKYFYRKNEEVITQIAKENELICSSVSFLTGVKSDYVVETIEPTTVVSLTRESMEKMYSKSYKMERLGRLVIIDWLVQKEYWETIRIKLGPKERFISFIHNNADLLIRVPQKYLASYLNIKPETFSRYKHLLSKKSSTNQRILNPSIDT